MKNLKANLIKVTMLLAILFVAGAGVNTQAKAKPKLSSKKITIKVGQKKKLKVKNVKKKKVKWSTKNKAIATVNKKGKVVGKKKGKTTIIAKVGKKKLKCKVTVKKKASAKKSSSKKNSTSKDSSSKISESVKQELPSAKQYRILNGPEMMAIGKTVDLFDYVYYAARPIKTPSNDAKVKGYKWTSSDSSIISIDKYGVATPKKAGKVNLSFKYLDRSGEWRESNSLKVEVINAGDVSFSFSYGLNKEWVDLTDQYFIDRVNLPGAFNHVNVTVTNNSDTAITMDNTLALYFTGWRYWKTLDNKDVAVPAHTTMTVLYRGTAGVWFTNKIEQLSPTYEIYSDDVIVYFDVENNTCEYAR